MKKIFTAFAALSLCTLLVIACTKDSGTIGTAPSPAQQGNGAAAGTPARPSGSNYSHSISVDTANRMIQSYLTGAGYPYADTTIRALSFDADTLRAYLQNPNIVTVKFMFAHPPAYMNSGNYGKNAGLNPDAVTMVIVGLNSDDKYVLNSHNGVYDNMSPCPAHCSESASSFIQ